MPSPALSHRTAAALAMVLVTLLAGQSVAMAPRTAATMPILVA